MSAHRSIARSSPVRVSRSLIAALLILACGIGSAADSPILGAMAPDFTLPSLRGGNLRLSDRLGEVVLLTFWTSPCNPCRQQLSRLDDLAAQYAGDGLVIFGINLDGDERRTAQAIRTLNVSYPILLDDLKNVSRSYQVEKMPVTVLIDRQGMVRYVSKGYRLGAEKGYADKLRELLKE
jgi:peroxiredoxin